MRETVARGGHRRCILSYCERRTSEVLDELGVDAALANEATFLDSMLATLTPALELTLNAAFFGEPTAFFGEEPRDSGEPAALTEKATAKMSHVRVLRVD